MSDSRPAVPREPLPDEDEFTPEQLEALNAEFREFIAEREERQRKLAHYDELAAAASRWEARALAAEQETRCNICDQPILHEIVCEDCLSERGFALAADQRETAHPRIICLCGSTKFIETFAVKTWELELEGYIVLGCTLLPSWYCPVRDHFAELQGVKPQRDAHHLQKIDLADEVLVLNVGGYIGESTRNEIAYATEHGKPVRYLEPLPAPPPPPQEGSK